MDLQALTFNQAYQLSKMTDNSLQISRSITQTQREGYLRPWMNFGGLVERSHPNEYDRVESKDYANQEELASCS